MPVARKIVEWVALALIRFAATCSVASGLAFFAAAGAVQAGSAVAGASPSWVRLVIGGSLGFALVQLVAGGISLYLRRARTAWLPDSLDSHASSGSGFDGWLILFPLTLIVVPTLMLFQLRPLADLWRDAFELADQVNFWQGLQRNAPDAGYVLMPVFIVLALPGVDAAAAVAAAVGSALLVSLLLVRSTRVPRVLLLCVILQGGLVLGSAVGAVMVERLAPTIEELVRSTPDAGGSPEEVRILAELQRYRAVVRSSSLTLAWSWGAMLVWAPILLFSVLGRATFAAVHKPGGFGVQTAADYSALDDQTRERAYLNAARQVDRSTRASRWF